VIETGQSEAFEEVADTPRGRRTFMSVKAPHRDVQGNVIGLIGISRDITERKQVEERVRKSEERFRSIFEKAAFGIALADMTGHVVEANAALAALLGYDQDELRGKLFSDFTHPDDAALQWPLIQKVASGEESHFQIEKRYIRKDGRQIWVLLTGSMFDRSPGERIGLATVADITARKQAEEALRQLNQELEQRVRARTADLSVASERLRAERQRFLDLLEKMPVIVVLLRPDYRVEWVNRAYREALGDNVGKLCFAAQFGRDKPCDECQAFVPLRTGKPQHWEWTLPNGRTFDSHNIPFSESDGSQLILEVDIDITERRQAEMALKELNEALERRVTERTVALTHSQRQLQLAMDTVRDANQKLTEADRRKDEFIALLSHELRNPLAPIRYALPILHSQSLDDFGSRAIGVVKRQTDQLTRLLDDLLDVGRITSGKLALRREQVTLRSVVTAAIETATPALSAAHHVLNMNITSERIWLNADPARLGQVLTNLLDNSAKFTPGGGEITLEAVRETDQAVIRVRDQGAGISPDALPRVFEMFRQGGTPGRSNGGLGIGLAIAKRLVDMHGGTIEAFSAGTGRGAEFVVRLPVVPEGKSAEPTHTASGGGAVGRTLKVLVVDDNQDLVEMLSLVVESGGHEVRKAFDGPEALSIARSYRPDVVLLDLGLPTVHGIEVAQELRRDPNTANARLIALTGWGQAEDREKTRAAGFDFHLTKPTEPEEVQQLLEAIAAGAPQAHQAG
jgi:PAS domain S-box-containing protein